MKYVFVGLVLVHGFIHLMGFAKAFQLGEQMPISTSISKPMGMIWLVTFILISSSLFLFFRGPTYWWVLAAVASTISQVLIFTVWKDAKFGTVANLIMLIAAAAGFFMHRFENNYKADVRAQI